MWTQIANHISETTGEAFEINNRRSVGGGCINQGYCVSGNTRTYFVKLNQASQVQMFEAEALGLKQMQETQTIRVPKPICWGTAADSSYIVLEWLELGGTNNSQTWEEMGRQLAAMHGCNAPTTIRFGLEQNNTIGSTPQLNNWASDWVEFFAE